MRQAWNLLPWLKATLSVVEQVLAQTCLDTNAQAIFHHL